MKIGSDKIKLVAACLLLAVALLSACEREENEGRDRKLFHVLRSEALSLYFDMYPLRGSRMELHRCDSMLFAYSNEEQEEISSRLRRLHSGFKKLSAAGLNEREYLDSRLLTRWVSGELFALEHLGDIRGNPLLYCWILDEALWGLPSRSTPPSGGELEAYLKRLDRIGKLLDNASITVVNPARPHTELAARLIRSQLASLPELEATLKERYGSEARLPDGLSSHIAGFLGFLEGTLSSQTRGNLILGSENISRIFRYDEAIDIDIIGTIEEAEKGIRRFRTELARIQQSVLVPDRSDHQDEESAGEVIERVLETVRGGFAANSFPESIRISDRALAASDRRVPSALMKSCNLTLHPMRPKAVALVPAGPFSNQPCVQFLFADTNRSKEELIYGILRELTLALPMEMLCRIPDTVRAIFPSEIYAGVVRFIEIERLIDLFPQERAELRSSLLEEKIRKLALTIVVLKLHAGTLTTESAILYLRSAAGLTAGEASRDIATATYAPTIAYPGISILEIERLRKRATVRGEVARTEERLRGVLMEQYFMPIPDIFARLPAE